MTRWPYARTFWFCVAVATALWAAIFVVGSKL